MQPPLLMMKTLVLLIIIIQFPSITYILFILGVFSSLFLYQILVSFNYEYLAHSWEGAKKRCLKNNLFSNWDHQSDYSSHKKKYKHFFSWNLALRIHLLKPFFKTSLWLSELFMQIWIFLFLILFFSVKYAQSCLSITGYITGY